MDQALMKLHLDHARDGAPVGDFITEPGREIRDIVNLQPPHPGYQGVYLNTYEVLFADQEHSSLNFYLPQTVVYRFNRPMAWFRSTRHPVPCTDPTTGETTVRYRLLKKRQSSLKNALILYSFLASEGGKLDPNDLNEDEDPERVNKLAMQQSQSRDQKKLPFVATFISVDGIRYLDEKDLQTFLLLSKDKVDGILQEFIVPRSPKSKLSSNDLIRCAWTPSVCYVERRRNIYTMDGTQLNEKGVSAVARAETFDGENYTTSYEAPVTSSKNLANFHLQTNLIANHFNRVTGGRLQLQSAVFHFKLLPDSDVVFLWADCVRMSLVKVKRQIRMLSAGTSSNQQQGPSTTNKKQQQQQQMASSTLTNNNVSFRSAHFNNKSTKELPPTTFTSKDEKITHEVVSRIEMPPPTEVELRKGEYFPLVEKSLSLDVQHKQHESVLEKNRAVCKICEEVCPRSDFNPVPYHVLLAAGGDVAWSVEKNMDGKKRRAERFTQFADEDQLFDEEKRAQSVMLTTKFDAKTRKINTSVRASTPAQQRQKKQQQAPVPAVRRQSRRGSLAMMVKPGESYTAEEAWKYEKFTSESFTQDPAKEFGNTAALARSFKDGFSEKIPLFIRQLHPYITWEQYETLRARNDFLETNAFLCTSCICRMTDGLASDFRTGSPTLATLTGSKKYERLGSAASGNSKLVLGGGGHAAPLVTKKNSLLGTNDVAPPAALQLVIQPGKAAGGGQSTGRSRRKNDKPLQKNQLSVLQLKEEGGFDRATSGGTTQRSQTPGALLSHRSFASSLPTENNHSSSLGLTTRDKGSLPMKIEQESHTTASLALNQSLRPSGKTFGTSTSKLILSQPMGDPPQHSSSLTSPSKSMMLMMNKSTFGSLRRSFSSMSARSRENENVGRPGDDDEHAQKKTLPQEDLLPDPKATNQQCTRKATLRSMAMKNYKSVIVTNHQSNLDIQKKLDDAEEARVAAVLREQKREVQQQIHLYNSRATSSTSESVSSSRKKKEDGSDDRAELGNSADSVEGERHRTSSNPLGVLRRGGGAGGKPQSTPSSSMQQQGVGSPEEGNRKKGLTLKRK